MVTTCLVNDKANNITCLGFLIQEEEAQRVKGPGDLPYLIYKVVKVRVMLMLVLLNEFNIPPQVWNTHSDITHRRNFNISYSRMIFLFIINVRGQA